MSIITSQEFTILIVDDLVENLTLLSELVEKLGYQNTFAKNGKQAIENVKKYKPDLILLDLMMPVMNGLECCKKLKSEPEYKDIPIIFITASKEEKYLTKAFELGASDYVTKPFQESEIRARIAHQLTICQQAKEIKKKNFELELANKKLSDFNHMICHDLRNPLSNIKGFTRLLEYKSMHKLDAGEQKFLEYINRSTNKISDLIDGLILLSEIKIVNWQVCEWVNLSEMVREILSEFQEENSQRQSEFILQPDLVAYGNKKLLKIACQNLLSNAWKYSSQKNKTLVKFAAVTKEILIKEKVQVPLDILNNLPQNQTIYFIQDNGAGFDASYAMLIFEIFQRLHTKEEFQGTGVGLAIVKNVIEIHGGKIWSNAKINEGATFYFYLGLAE